MLCKRIIVKMLKKNNLSDQAYDELVRRIVSGTFPAGRMLQEEKLSSEFGISRTPVREALQRLSAEGLVEQLPRRGYRVSLPDEEALKELYECRTGLELMALNLALGEIPEQEIFALEKKTEKRFRGKESRTLARSGYGNAFADNGFQRKSLSGRSDPAVHDEDGSLPFLPQSEKS